MAKLKGLNSLSGLVYSTDPNYIPPQENNEAETLQPAQQRLRVQLETKHRGGKTASVVLGFVGKQDDMELVGKQLKNICGTGGSVKDGEIIIQGDHRDKIIQWFLKNGYRDVKKTGG